MSFSLSDRAPSTLHEVSAGMSTYAGARLVTLEDGAERGMRVIEIRSGGGLDFDVIVDRCGDIGRLSCDGQTLSWHAAGGLRSPWLMDADGDAGQGFLRGYGGFLNTCGFDHIRQPDQDNALSDTPTELARQSFPLHGKGAFQPCVIRGYGLNDEVETPYVFCEIECVQAISFGTTLRLRRRIEIAVGSRHITLHDEVCNIGTVAATHMLLYHFNLGFPLVASGTELKMSDSAPIWHSTPHDALAPFVAPDPQAQNVISVFKHKAATAQVRVDNRQTNHGVLFEYPSDQLPYCQLLRMQSPGIYGIGIEPCTAGGRTRQDARAAGDMIILQPTQKRDYDLSISLTKPQTT
ncbi:MULTISPECIES: DUF4432 family protein [Pacificibacter]|uniref:DUF4432 family protein n=1 Tax=Pacificibacter TaxID=1042323 RepID=UPI001C09D87D|nr:MULTISPECIES: DUF4432 family protein [Pacificibacter]MBU2935887.1 DUF4432 family protein [Pacificibacter marinus]MDO6614382.1 DUF4432 family protein [Pacificibacter sp. 1_MG-2023]